jgi:hypothetical protein
LKLPITDLFQADVPGKPQTIRAQATSCFSLPDLLLPESAGMIALKLLPASAENP